MAETLSQEEVDALLRGIADGDVPIPEDADSIAHAPRYELLRERRLADPDAAALVLVHERFASELAKELASMVGKSPTVECAGRSVASFGRFRDRIPRGANLCWFGTSRGEDRGLLVVPPRLAFEIVDCVFGGPGRAPASAADRHPSPTEVQTLRRFAETVVRVFAAACAPVARLDLALGAGSDSTAELALGNAAEVLLLLEMDCDLGGGAARIVMALPRAVREQLSGVVDEAQADEEEASRGWARAIRTAIGGVEVSLAAELGRRELRAREILRLRVGDVLPLSTRGDDPLVVRIEGAPLLRGVAGVSRGQNAVRVLDFDRAT